MIYFFVFLFASTALVADDSIRRIESLLTIGDAQAAIIELQPLLAQDPDNLALQRLEVASLARRDDITAILRPIAAIATTQKAPLIRPS